MKILSLKASNYRIHSGTYLEFDPTLTLIGGPNESGKSTLVEAAFNALFMRFKKTGDELDRMLSDAGGIPEVELVFEQAGKTYTLKKIFRGTGGRAHLDSSDGTIHLQGDEAEQKLFELLGIAPPPPKSREIPQQWAHLWVRQGQSSDSPADTVAERKEQLLNLLQQGANPAAAILQSPEDARLAGKFSDLRNSLFKEDGKSARVNTDLGQAELLHRTATRRREGAETRCAELEDAANNLEAGLADHEEAVRILAESRLEFFAVEAQLQRANQLQAEVALRTSERDSLAGQLHAIQSADQEIRQKEQELASETASSAPLMQAVTDAEALENASRKDIALHDTQHRALITARLDAENRRDLYTKCVAKLRLREEIAQHRALVEEAAAIRNDIVTREQELAGGANVTSRDITNLQALETAGTQARASLDAIATRIQVIRSGQPVRFGDKTLQGGEHMTFSGEDDLCIGDIATIRITPGGGTNLQEARETLQQTEQALADRLRALGVTNVTEARASQEKRSVLDVEIKGLRDRLAAFQDPELILPAKESELVTLTSEIDQRSALLAGFQLPSELATANQLLQTAENDYLSAKQNEETSSAHLRILNAALEDATHRVSAARDQARVSQERQIELSARIAQRVADHGDHAARTGKIAALSQRHATAELQVKATNDQLQDLHPDLLTQQKSRLESSISAETTRRDTAFQRIADARAKLNTDGTTDPRQALAVALAQESATLRKLQEKQRHGEAIKLLSELFSREQDALNTRLAGPLEEKVGGYLQCIFGRGSAASIPIRDGSFSGFNLRRDGVGTFDFSALSGGTKEQVAIAFRLAMAEVIAADHGGSLPVILDDAFTNSDEERTKKLRDMLYRATTKGLQVIVFSCNPRDYQGLGGKTITLSGRSTLTAPATQSIHSQAQQFANPPASPEHSGDSSGDQPEEVQVETLSPAADIGEERVNTDIGAEVTQAQRDVFLSALRAMEGHSSGNASLRKHLCWSELLYNAVKEALISEGTIEPGKGRGGSISLIL
jgi:DNA repair exonuclease SbcCD ATPase subunit